MYAAFTSVSCGIIQVSFLLIAWAIDHTQGQSGEAALLLLAAGGCTAWAVHASSALPESRSTCAMQLRFNGEVRWKTDLKGDCKNKILSHAHAALLQNMY